MFTPLAQYAVQLVRYDRLSEADASRARKLARDARDARLARDARPAAKRAGRRFASATAGH